MAPGTSTGSGALSVVRVDPKFSDEALEKRLQGWTLLVDNFSWLSGRVAQDQWQLSKDWKTAVAQGGVLADPLRKLLATTEGKIAGLLDVPTFVAQGPGSGSFSTCKSSRHGDVSFYVACIKLPHDFYRSPKPSSTRSSTTTSFTEEGDAPQQVASPAPPDPSEEIEVHAKGSSASSTLESNVEQDRRPCEFFCITPTERERNRTGDRHAAPPAPLPVLLDAIQDSLCDGTLFSQMHEFPEGVSIALPAFALKKLEALGKTEKKPESASSMRCVQRPPTEMCPGLKSARDSTTRSVALARGTYLHEVDRPSLCGIRCPGSGEILCLATLAYPSEHSPSEEDCLISRHSKESEAASSQYQHQHQLILSDARDRESARGRSLWSPSAAGDTRIRCCISASTPTTSACPLDKNANATSSNPTAFFVDLGWRSYPTAVHPEYEDPPKQDDDTKHKRLLKLSCETSEDREEEKMSSNVGPCPLRIVCSECLRHGLAGTENEDPMLRQHDLGNKNTAARDEAQPLADWEDTSLQGREERFFLLGSGPNCSSLAAKEKSKNIAATSSTTTSCSFPSLAHTRACIGDTQNTFWRGSRIIDFDMPTNSVRDDVAAGSAKSHDSTEVEPSGNTSSSCECGASLKSQGDSFLEVRRYPKPEEPKEMILGSTANRGSWCSIKMTSSRLLSRLNPESRSLLLWLRNMMSVGGEVFTVPDRADPRAVGYVIYSSTFCLSLLMRALFVMGFTQKRP
ncbi:unnamed protein product [Amoebophrya sp. A25]|nr:unnamed protein product [Amoebophrya sp. A25]|eukprot:GSA25T00019144001.1